MVDVKHIEAGYDQLQRRKSKNYGLSYRPAFALIENSLLANRM